MTDIDINSLPGEHLPVVSNFCWGVFVGIVEVSLLYLLLQHLFSVKKQARANKKQWRRQVKNQSWTPSPPVEQSATSTILGWVGAILAALGWAYWAITAALWWNFISNIMIGFLFLVLPAFLWYTFAKGNAGQGLLWTRIKLNGWLLGLVVLLMFPNVFLLPQQIERRLDVARSVILPNDPAVAYLEELFWNQTDANTFWQANFEEQVFSVELFIYNNIEWESDMSQYYLLGLLLDPAQVVEKMAADCEGQASVTSSLLIRLGFDAWMVETPFHWWTLARNKTTGQVKPLNFHGNAGRQGNVLPQPIVQIFTNPGPSCVIGEPIPRKNWPSNCTETDAYNVSPTLYFANPWTAFMKTWTGAHEFKRDILPGLTLGKLCLFGILFGLPVMLYASYFQQDFSLDSSGWFRWLCRYLVGLGSGQILFLGMSFWGYTYYPFVMIHLAFVLAFALTFPSSDNFNALLDTPSLRERFQTKLWKRRERKQARRNRHHSPKEMALLA